MELSLYARLAELKREMNDIRLQDLEFWTSKRRYVREASEAHDRRVVRMKQILEEIAKLMKKRVE